MEIRWLADVGEGLKRLSFAKNKRLVSSRQFKAVLDCRRRVCGELLTVYLAGNECSYSRLGVSVAKSCGGSVARNHIKRLIREAFRLSQGEIPAGFDYLVMITPAWVQRQAKAERLKEAVMGLSLNEVKRAFEGLAKSAFRKGQDGRNPGGQRGTK